MTVKATLAGKNLAMLPFASENAPRLCQALSRDPYELFLTSSQMAFPVTESAFEKYRQEAAASGTHEIFSFVDKAREDLVGHCELKAISPRHLHGTIANVFVLPERRGQRLGVEMVRLVLAYAFEKRGLQRVGLAVHTNNSAAISTYLKAGFQIEGLIREVLRFEEKNYSLYQMSVLAREFTGI